MALRWTSFGTQNLWNRSAQKRYSQIPWACILLVDAMDSICNVSANSTPNHHTAKYDDEKRHCRCYFGLDGRCDIVHYAFFAIASIRCGHSSHHGFSSNFNAQTPWQKLTPHPARLSRNQKRNSDGTPSTRINTNHANQQKAKVKKLF